MDKYQIIQEFEQKIRHTFWFAFVAGFLHKAATWLGGGAVTWATVVLMGGFASQLDISDFLTITWLVLLVIFLLALALLTCKLVSKKSLSTGSFHPVLLTYHDRRLMIVNAIKFISFILQCSLLIWAFSISASKIHRPDGRALYSYAFGKPHVDTAAPLASLQACLQSCATNHRLTAASDLQACSEFCFPAQNSTCSVTANLQVCLFVFHSLVIATCFMAMLCNLSVFSCIQEAWRFMHSGVPKSSLSLMRYHDEVLSRALSIGLVEADEFNWREFLMWGVGEDLVVRSIAPLEVKSQNEDFIKYLFYYPKGVEMVMGMLASENTLLQQTAANMPGFWSSEHKGMEKDGMELLSRLGEKLGMPGKVAEGAANSFKALAIAWEMEKVSPLLKVYVSRSGGSGGESSRALVLTSGEIGSGTPASVGSGVESTNAVSRYAGADGGGESTNAVSRSGGDGAGSGSRSTQFSNETPSSGVGKEESIGRGGSGTGGTVSISEGRRGGDGASSSGITRSEGGEGHGHCQSSGEGNGCKSSDMGSVCSGSGEVECESMSSVPESSDTVHLSRGEGQQAGTEAATAAVADQSRGSRKSTGAASNRSVRSGGLGGGGSGGDKLKWNVVQKVVDLVVNKRVPTLQVYVRALDSFFMSKSVRESLTTEEREQIRRKLRRIIGGESNQAASASAEHASVVIDSSHKVRTRLLAFSALDRLGSEPHDTCLALLQHLDSRLNEVHETSVIWVDEIVRYKKLCRKYEREPGQWLTSGKWEERKTRGYVPRD